MDDMGALFVPLELENVCVLLCVKAISVCVCCITKRVYHVPADDTGPHTPM
jgi:hypothetical protein